MKNPYHLHRSGKYRLRNGFECDPEEVVSIDTPWRYRQEIMLLQEALGVPADGLIGPETRRAASKAWERRNGKA